MRVPQSKSGQFAFFFAAEAFCFFIIVANTRAIARDSYLWTAITEVVFGLQGFIVAKLMIDDKNGRTWSSGLGSTVGGMFGSLLSMWMTKHLY